MGLLWNRQILAINWHLQSSNVFFLFHSVLEFPGKWIGKIKESFNNILIFGLVHKHSLQTSRHNLLHVFSFLDEWDYSCIEKETTVLYEGFFFRGDLYIWSSSILYFFFVFICLLIIHYRREYTRYGSYTRGFA